jgi:hypothetical protein
MIATYGEIETYFTDGLSIDSGTIARLRTMLIEPTAPSGD